MKDCPNCEYHKQRAQLWRHEAYKLSGHPLDWEPDLMQRTWVGLSEEEVEACFHHVDEAGIGLFDFAEAIEAKLKEKNNG